MNTLKGYVHYGLLLLIAGFVLGLSGHAEALAPESPGLASCEVQTLLQFAAEDEDKAESSSVKESGGTLKEFCPRYCERKARYCTEWLSDGKCKLWAIETYYYCCN